MQEARRSRAGASFWAEEDERRRVMRNRDRASRRQARRVGALGFAAAAALPIVLWHRVIGVIAEEFRLELNYLISGWTPWFLIALGLTFFLPVAWSAGRDPDSRWYPRARNAYAGWGITLYLLGCALATQVAEMAETLARN
jgi:hypothetical protein